MTTSMTPVDMPTDAENYRHSQYLTVFQEVTRLISMVHEPQQVMDMVVSTLPGLLDLEGATIRLLDKATNTFVVGAARGVSPEYLSRAYIDTAEVLAAVRRGEPASRSGLHLEGDERSKEAIAAEGIVSVLSLPIVYKDEVAGLVRLLSKRPRTFSRMQVEFCMALAEQIGIALANSRMHEEMAQQISYLKAVRHISQLVNSTLDLNQILNAIVQQLPPIMEVSACTIRLLHPATNRLELMAASGLSDDYLNRGSISREDAIFKALSGEPVAIYDATKDVRVNYHEEILQEGIKSILAVPLRSGSEVIGVLRLLTAYHHLFTPAEIDFAMSVAEEGGNAIEKARTYRKIELLFNQIEEHERFLSTIMDSLWLQLLVLSPDRRIIMVNKMFCKTHGIAEKDVLGRDYHEISPWASPRREDCPVDRVFTDGRPVAILDKLSHGDHDLWFERHLSPIFDDDGKIEIIIEAVRDITDQKLLEKEKLEKMKLQGVVEMAGTAAHNINSPLFAALGTAQLLVDDISDQQTMAELQLIIKNLRAIGALTKEMTAVTGFESKDYVGDARIVELTSSPWHPAKT
jgi:two-component system NtrC family sensor kinase